MTQTWHHLEQIVEVPVPAEPAFEYLDDHERLGAHMKRSSWMMAGSKMAYELDASKGHTVGSVMRLSGRVLGVPLAVDSAVTERTPPLHKTWETRGVPKLLVIGPYRMGFELSPRGATSKLRVFIDYLLPEKGIERLLGRLFGRFYASWCVRSMASDAARQFAATSG